MSHHSFPNKKTASRAVQWRNFPRGPGTILEAEDCLTWGLGIVETVIHPIPSGYPLVNCHITMENHNF